MISQNKRILCVISSLGSGGAERQLVGLAIMLKNKGYQVKVSWYGSDDFYEQQLIDNQVERGKFQASNVLSTIIGLRREILDYKADLVIAFLKRPSMYACVLKALGMNFKLVVSERNITVGELSFSQKIKFQLYKYSDRIVPNSYTQGNYILNKYPTYKDKICIINNFANLDFFKPLASKKVNIPLSVLVAARVTEQKNVKSFLKAISIAKSNGANIRVSWFGDPFPETYLEDCYSLLDKLQLNAIISFYPATKDILHEYQKADVFCLPSLYEGFPNVIGEAMACGLPVICSNVSDNPMLVKENVNGFLFDPTDVESMSTALMKVSKLSHDIIEQMGKKSREMAMNMLTEEAFINKYMELIEAI